MIVIDREVGSRVQRHFVELVIGAWNGHFTVQVDARTVRREEAAVKMVIRPAVVEREIIRRESGIIVGGAVP